MSSEAVENIPSRLKEELKRLGMSMAAASREAGESSPQRLKDVISGRQKCPVELLARLKILGVDVVYVLTGERVASAVRNAVAHGQRSFDPEISMAVLRLYDIEAAAGAGRSLEAEEIEATLHFPTAELEERGLDPAHVVGVRVRGDSMEATLADGDWVLVDRSDCPDRPEGVFLLLVHGERRIKRVQRVAGGGWYLISDNDLYQPELIKPEDKRDVRILGRCVMRIGGIS